MDDRAAVAVALAKAFFDDPVPQWSCPPDDLRDRVLQRVFSAMLNVALPHGEVWTTTQRSGAAIWFPPDFAHLGAADSLRLLRAATLPRLLPRMPAAIAGALKADAIHRRQRPHWYLFSLGVDPSAQGQGLGSRLIAPVLEQCDADQIGAYLESSKQENIPFYARHGFKETEPFKLPSGPVIYPMWREPRS